MITDEKILENKNRYYELLRSTKRDGVENLIEWLEQSDFEIAPASCKYHQNFKGGLCEHCLNVYDNLIKLYKNFINEEIEEDKLASLTLISLLHDLAKVNFYEQFDKNVKVDGKWVQEKCYRVRGVDDRLIFNNHEQTSLFIATQFIPLSLEEQVSIGSHHGGMGNSNTSIDIINEIYAKYKLPMYLHIADLMDAFNE